MVDLQSRSTETLLTEPFSPETSLPGWAAESWTAITAVPVVFWLASIVAAALWPVLYAWLAVEDHLFETIQNLTLAAAVVVAAIACNTMRRQGMKWWSLLYAFGTVALFWLLGEEISWGQRIFGWGTPEALSHNPQGESNLHNLPGVTSTLSRIVVIALPITVIASWALWSRGWRFVRQTRLYLWMPHPILIPAWLCFWSYTPLRELDKWYFDTTNVQTIVSRLQESAEVVLYGAVLLFLLMALSRLKALPEAGDGDSVLAVS